MGEGGWGLGLPIQLSFSFSAKSHLETSGTFHFMTVYERLELGLLGSSAT